MATTQDITVTGIVKLPNSTMRRFITGPTSASFEWSADPLMAAKHFYNAAVGVDLPAIDIYVKPAFTNSIVLTVTSYD